MSLLHAVMQKIRSPEVLPTTPEAQDVSLTGLMDQYAALIDLQSRRQLITVQMDNHRQSFQSLILDINFSQRLLVLDELFPTAPQPAIGQCLHLSHQHMGKIMQFEAPVLERQTIAGSPCYLVPLPEALGYRQRRRHPRLLLDEQVIPVKLQSPWRSHWFGSLSNLSAGGMRLMVNGDKLREISRGSRLPNIQFELSRQMRIQCDGKIRSFRFIRRPMRQTEISVEFTGLTSDQYGLLSHYVDTLLAQNYRAA
ncbi:flagellar brake protein [Simiduia aestuariiviva]|uniref:C-di-GMP-binding flagellar brake protein YcgR n=1 Tax=Simiduia aestuariiviva TaxID=1510459 RepID=A0A839UPR3_9GAMM|nr:flagellar brake protein [Simiduia aestuariiviva]MBB3168479.1 c-di-GMP-binding flagellar brake protein YcgR [Simiduia aestuariiviva]